LLARRSRPRGWNNIQEGRERIEGGEKTFA